MKFKTNRQCGSCIACCDGRLVLDIFNTKRVGEPCHYVSDKGCTIYKHRPKDPCRIFECGWLRDKEYKYPAWLNPDKSGLLLMDWKKTKSGIPYIIAVAGREGYNKEALIWLVDYCNSKDLNIEFILQGSKHYFGTKAFRKEFKK